MEKLSSSGETGRRAPAEQPRRAFETHGHKVGSDKIVTTRDLATGEIVSATRLVLFDYEALQRPTDGTSQIPTATDSSSTPNESKQKPRQTRPIA